MPLVASVAVTVVFASTAPEGSVTVPLISPEAPTPCAHAIPVAISRIASNTFSTLNNLIGRSSSKIVRAKL